MKRSVAVLAVLVCVVSGCASAQDFASAPGNGGPKAGGKHERKGKAPGHDKKDKKDKKNDADRPRKKSDRNFEVNLRNVVGKVESFSSPSANIGCRISDSGVRCDISERSYRPPRKPGKCDLDFGNALTVAEGEPSFACVGDTVLGAQTKLAYGTATRVGKYGCQSRRDGMRCYNLRTGRGFLVSRALYEFY